MKIYKQVVIIIKLKLN